MTYVLSLREQLESMAEHVQEYLHKAQMYQKAWYDRNAWDRSFQPGDQVLILLPVSSNLTMIDLTKGYWQVPVASEYRHRTAFARYLGSLNLMSCHLASRERQGHFKG